MLAAEARDRTPEGTESAGEEEALVPVFFSADPFAKGISLLFKRRTECWVRHYFNDKRAQKIKKYVL